MVRGKIIVIHEEDRADNSDGKLTTPVIIICIVVASAGFMFGYETGFYGNVTRMHPFLKKFFPLVFLRLRTSTDPFCIFKSSKLSAYASSLYIAGIFSALLSGRLTTSAGRKGALIIGGIIYLIGVSLQALAANIQMLILGRIIMGFGIGFTNQAAPMYLVEVAPAKWRGAIATGFPLFFEIGMFTATWISFFFIRIYPDDSRCWRIPISISALPAFIMTVIAFFIPDTPSSLIQRGKVQAALRSLNQVRGIDVDIENELKHLIKYHEAMRNACEKPYRTLFDGKYRHQLLLTLVIPTFRQLSGMQVIGVFVPVLFRCVGISSQKYLLANFIHGSITILSVLVATCLIDRVGRRILLLQGGLQIFICEIVMAIVIALDVSGTPSFSVHTAIIAMFLTVFINASFSWSWGTINLILPCEILPMEVRAAGQGLFVAINFAFQFLVAQTMLPMLCYFRQDTFLFYAGVVLVITIFVFFFVPETKGVPLESMDIIWRNHWYWRRFVHGTNTLLNPENDDNQFRLR